MRFLYPLFQSQGCLYKGEHVILFMVPCTNNRLKPMVRGLASRNAGTCLGAGGLGDNGTDQQSNPTFLTLVERERGRGQFGAVLAARTPTSTGFKFF